ncbi:hypothetical protein V8G54_035906 [Vigna mungo]|uniref:Uncharacterized protein n=1 Tax=Vigna mungo TaxID=3915 RepID=A0AAQ3MG60_VIGMU
MLESLPLPSTCASLDIDDLLAHLDTRQPQELPQVPPIALHLHLFVLQDEDLLQEQHISDAVSPDAALFPSVELSFPSSELVFDGLFSMLTLLLDFLFLKCNFFTDCTHSSSVTSSGT